MVGKAKRPRLHQAAPRPRGPRDPEPGGHDGAGGTSGWRAEPGKDWAFLSSDVFAGLKIDPKTLVKKLDLDSRSIVSAQTDHECRGEVKPGLTRTLVATRLDTAAPIDAGRRQAKHSAHTTGSRFHQSSLPMWAPEEGPDCHRYQCAALLRTPGGVEEKPLLSKREKMKLRKDRWLQKIEGVKLARQKQKAEAKRKATPVVGDLQPLMEALPELSELTTTSKARKQPKIYDVIL
ncbi:protein FAM207A isoform X2 [Chelonia mydas]|uniref:protein FAM207A isoform X2 n=1 Tax=Chelonia mydas TaxID=8469 RepID=UPI001CA9BEC9|nr:protein FAM207A isoform X2 [Chelonia mydas]